MTLFIELSAIIGITTVLASVARILRQPLIVGYIASGIIVGPYVLNLIHSTEQIELFSQIGISILLFIVGLSLNPESIRETGKTAVVTGVGQVLFTSFFGFFLMQLLGFSVAASLYGAIALTFSSTIIILKLLSDKGDLGKLYGRVSIGFLLVQDFIATLLLLIVPMVGAHAASGGQGAIFLDLFLKGAGAGLVLYGVSKYLLPRLSFFLARSQELLFLFSVAWGLGLASLFYIIGFSIEIGALIAGITLSVSSYSFEISSRARPLRDFFIVLFFVLLGSRVVLGDISVIVFPAVVLSFFVLIGNPLIVFILMNLLGYRSRTAFMAGLTVAQISEFSLILMALGESLGHVDRTDVSLITLVGMLTIIGCTYLMIYGDTLYNRLRPMLRHLEFRKHQGREAHHREDPHDMIILGYGRVGFEFVHAAKHLSIPYLVVDYNPQTMRQLKLEGASCRYGDAEDVEFLDEIELAKAKIVVSTIPDPNVNLLLVRHYRRKNPDGLFMAVSHGIPETRSLYLEGASYVVMPHYLGAQHASKMILEHGLDHATFEHARNEQLSRITEYERNPL